MRSSDCVRWFMVNWPLVDAARGDVVLSGVGPNRPVLSGLGVNRNNLPQSHSTVLSGKGVLIASLTKIKSTRYSEHYLSLGIPTFHRCRPTIVTADYTQREPLFRRYVYHPEHSRLSLCSMSWRGALFPSVLRFTIVREKDYRNNPTYTGKGFRRSDCRMNVEC